ncbi:MAG TPA: hypothetical protein VKV02_12195 [Acidobacteriaceae bacterium]|nr:hypothetical protein [Acidobacteriaceae bacterium]
MATLGQEHDKIEQLQHASPDELEHAAGRERENLEGWIPALATESEIREALEKAFDYRGDVTITRKDGSVVEGYLYDRRTGRTLEDSVVRLIPAPAKGAPAGSAIQRINIAYADVAALRFSGRDTAAGKTFEAWVKKYWEKKAAGEKNIQIVPEKLD